MSVSTRLGFWFFALGWLVAQAARGQAFTVSGRVTDAQTGDPVPFAAVGLKGRPTGTNTNFEGYYTLKTSALSDSIFVSALGFRVKAKALDPAAPSQTVHFQLEATSYALQEVKVYAGENPAYRVVRQAVAAKRRHDWRRLTAYEYDSYSKIEFDVNQLSDRFRNGRLGKKIVGPLDRLEKIAGDDGKPIIPIFLSESVSTYHYRTDPVKSTEKVLKTRIEGVGVTDGSLISQLIGSTFQQYNFYENWLLILRKDFVSPLAESWRTSYEYFLADTVWVGDDYCYELEVDPRRKQDLAFVGKIWIDTTHFGLRQVDLSITGEANLNYVEAIKIQQELEPVGTADSLGTVWLPAKTRVLLDLRQLPGDLPGMLAKFQSTHRNFVVNRPRPLDFYAQSIDLAPDYREPNEGYWRRMRPDSLTRDERLAYSLIDSVKNIPVIKTYSQLLLLAATGYQRVYTGIELGPFLSTAALNTFEGLRVRVGFRTNAEFSRRWVIKSYLAYGTNDRRFKYGADLRYILSRQPWTELGLSHSYDLEQIGLTSEAVGDNGLFAAYTRFGAIRRPFFQNDVTAYFRGEVVRGLTPMIGLRHRTFEPLYRFAYNLRPDLGGASPQRAFYETTELLLGLRYAKNEQFLINDNERISMGTERAPIYTFRYAAGLRNTLGGDFRYHRFTLSIADNFRVGQLGRSYAELSLGYTPSTLPYPLLFAHLGNQSWFYVGNAYNLMNFFEFMSDRYVALRLEHNFQGLLFNRIPAIKKLKWRSLVNANVLYGGTRQENRDLIPDTDLAGNPIPGFGALNPRVPYVELGYGIENIFKFFRVQAIHRLTYRNPVPTIDAAPVSKFAVKFSAYFTL